MRREFPSDGTGPSRARRSLIAALGIGCVTGCLRLEQDDPPATSGNAGGATEGESDRPADESGPDDAETNGPGGETSSGGDADGSDQTTTAAPNPLRITDVRGLRTNDGDDIAALSIGIRRDPEASGGPNLSLLEVNIVGFESVDAIMTHARSGSGFYVEPVGETGQSAQRLEPGERARVNVPLGDSPAARDYAEEFAANDPLPNTAPVVNDFGLTFDPGELIGVATRIVDDGRSEVRFTVPESLGDEDGPVAFDLEVVDE